jgi:hypothetical protein
MRKRKLLYLGVILVILVLGALLDRYAPWDPRGPIGYWRVHLGMPEDEVAAVLGGPGRDCRPVRHIGGMTSPGPWRCRGVKLACPVPSFPNRAIQRRNRNPTSWSSNGGVTPMASMWHSTDKGERSACISHG